MKLKYISNVIILFSFLISCKNNKDSVTLNDWFNAYRVVNNDVVTFTGRAMKGRLKAATIKVIPLSEDGKCDKDSKNILGSTLTDERGDYVVAYRRIGAPVCLFVVPEDSGSSKMYDEFSKRDLDWTGNSYLVSVLKEPATMVRRKSGLAISPLTRFGASRLAALAEQSGKSANTSDLVTKANKEISARFGIRNSIFSIRNTFSNRAEVIDNAPEISEVPMDFDNPSDPNVISQKAILGGISVIANQTQDVSGYSSTDVDEVLDTFSSYIASGRNDGKDTAGNVLTIPGSDVPLGNNAVSSVINSAVGTYIQSGGANEIGVPISTINSIISFVDSIPDPTATLPADTTPPQVLSYSPANATTNVPQNTTITIVFDETIDTSSTSLNAQSSDGTCRGTVQVSADEFINCVGMTINASSNPTISLTPVNPLQGNSTYKIRVTTGLVDIAMNPVALSTSTGFDTVDLIQPTVTSVTSTTTNGSYKHTDTVNVRLNFNRPVLVTGSPRILLNTTPSAYANYVSGSGTNILDFSYTVTGPENSTDLDYATTSSLELNGATMTNINTLVSAILTLPAPSGIGSLGANKNIVIDNTPPNINFALSGSANSESITSPTIAVNLSKPFYLTTTIDYAVTGGTASGSGVDYTLASGTLTFNPAVTTQSISLSIINDTLDETNETIVITLSNPSNGALGTNSTHTYTITNDDTPPALQFTTTTSSNTESTTAVNLGVDLSLVSGKTITVNYTVSGGSASAGGVDYTFTNGTLTFAPGVTSQNISFTVANDTIDEDDETIVVTLSSPANATFAANTTHTYTILNDDIPPNVQFTQTTSASLNETTSISTIDVVLSSVSGKTVSVLVTDTGGSATSGSDYTLLGSPITLTFSPGQTAKTINVPVIQDLLAEGNETIVLTLGTYSNVTAGTNTSHTFTITDDDFLVSTASTLDCNENGKIDHYKITFASTLNDASFPGYIANGLGSTTTAWLVAGYSGVRLRHGTGVNSVCPAETDTANDDTIYLAFNEGGSFDTGAKPDVTTTSGLGLTGLAGTAGIIFTGSLTEADGAKPIVTSISPADTTSNIDILSFSSTAVFSEEMNTSSFTNANFTVTGLAGIAGNASIVSNTSPMFTASVNLVYNQSHTINITNMADVNGQIMVPFSSSFTTSIKNKVTGTITNGGTGVTVRLTVNGSPVDFNGTTNYTTTELLGIGDIYSLFISVQPVGKVCALVSTPSNPTGGTFTGTSDLTINVNCVDGYSNGSGLTAIPQITLNMHLLQGNVTTFAGQGTNGYLDGTGGGAQFSSPIGITFDGQNFFVVDSGNNYIRKISPAGTVTTIAGNGAVGNADGILVASFNQPRGIATDGTYLYISEDTGNRIKRVRISNGYAETIAGDNSVVSPTGADANGIGTAARFNLPTGLAIENNILFIADKNNGKIKKLDLATKDVTVLASASPLNTPEQITLVGNYLYVANGNGNNIIRVDKTSGAMTVFAGDNSNAPGFIDSVGTSARFNNPMGITNDGENLYVADYSNHCIRRIEIANQKVNTLAGNGSAGNTNGTGIAATLNSPVHITTNGKNFFASNSHSIRKISENGLIAYYPLKNGFGYDYAGNNTLTSTGTPTSTTGRFSEANGAFTIGAGNGLKAPATSGTTNISIAGWVKWDGTSGGTNQILFYNGSSGTNGFGFLLNTTNQLRCLFGGGSSIALSPGLSPNVWTHLALVGPTSGGGSWKVYFNGREILSAIPALSSPAGFFTIGMNDVNGENFRGAVADMRVYSRSLNENDINELAQRATQANVGDSYNNASTGLVLNFHMDNGSNNSSSAIPDLGLTGSTGASAIGKDGNTNGSRIFDGSSHYLSTNTPYGVPPGKSSRTICSWVKLDSFPAPASWFAIATHGSPITNEAFGIGIYNNNPTTQVVIPTWGTDYFFNTNIPLHTWNHICASYDGTSVVAFANGVQLGSPQSAVSINTGTALFRIGAFVDGAASSKFKGSIDDVRIYNNALTATQIRQIAGQSLSGLVARYDFIGDTNDVSGLGNNLSPTSLTPAPNKWGAPNSSFVFSSSSVASGANPATLAVDNVSLTAWIRPTQYDAGLHIVIINGEPSSTGFGIQIDGFTGTLKAILGNVSSLTTNAKIPLNVWSHVALRRSSGTWQLFLNGVSVPNTSGSASATPLTPNALRVGSSPAGDEKFIGSITDARVYTKALTDSEILTLSGYHPMQVSSWDPISANSSLGVHLQADSFPNTTDNSVVGNWTDSSGNNFHATQFNGPLFRTGANGINGKPAIQLNGTNQYFDAGNTSLSFSGLSVFAVGRNNMNAGPNFRPFVTKDGGACIGSRFNLHRNTNNNDYFFETNAGSITTAGTVGENVILTAINNGTNLSLSKNGISPSNAGTSAINGTTACPLQVGGRTTDNLFFQGLIGEVLVFKAPLSAGDKDIVECYLSTKYNLPISHSCP